MIEAGTRCLNFFLIELQVAEDSVDIETIRRADKMMDLRLWATQRGQVSEGLAGWFPGASLLFDSCVLLSVRSVSWSSVRL